MKSEKHAFDKDGFPRSNEEVSLLNQIDLLNERIDLLRKERIPVRTIDKGSSLKIYGVAYEVKTFEGYACIHPEDIVKHSQGRPRNTRG